MKHNTMIDPVAYLQISISRMFMKRHSLTPEEFLNINEKKDILGFLRLGYEPFHLTGEEGVLEELDEYIFGKHKMGDRIVSS